MEEILLNIIFPVENNQATIDGGNPSRLKYLNDYKLSGRQIIAPVEMYSSQNTMRRMNYLDSLKTLGKVVTLSTLFLLKYGIIDHKNILTNYNHLSQYTLSS